MKAWIFQNDEGFGFVIFAETKNKARLYVLGQDYADGYEYIEIKVRRWKEADKYWNGKDREMDWNNPEHRRFLCAHGWSCCGDYEPDDCKTCAGREFCYRWQETQGGQNADIQSKERVV